MGTILYFDGGLWPGSSAETAVMTSCPVCIASGRVSQGKYTSSTKSVSAWALRSRRGHKRPMTLPKVVLIGRPPFVGKSAAARCIAARYGYGCISTDDIGKAVGAVTTVQTHARLPTLDDTDFRDYFTMTSVDTLIEHAKQTREIIWPALENIIRTHSTWGDPLVMEGYALWPEQVMAADFVSTGAVWLACDDQLLKARIRSQTSFYRGASDEEALIANAMKRSSRYNELMVESAMKGGATVISIEIGHSVEDIADLCVSALEEDQSGSA